MTNDDNKSTNLSNSNAELRNEEARKLRLKQKRARLILEETNLRIRQRKARTRNLIELGGLITKVELDTLPANTLYGALLSLKEALTNDKQIITIWAKKGDAAFTLEKKEKIPVILKLDSKPDKHIRDHIRLHGLKWNSMRGEWWGYATSLESLKEGLNDLAYDLHIVNGTD